MQETYYWFLKNFLGIICLKIIEGLKVHKNDSLTGTLLQ